MSTKSVIAVIDEVLGIPPEDRGASLRLMGAISSMGEEEVRIIEGDGSREALVKCLRLIREMDQEDRDEVLKFLDRTAPASEKIISEGGPIIDSRCLAPATFDEPSSRGGMMDKARQFISGLPAGAKVTPISICKRADINPANMYQFCKSLAKEGILQKIGFAKYKVIKGVETTNDSMKMAVEIASLKRGGGRKAKKGVSVLRYIESIPPKKAFKLAKVKAATGKKWNAVSATACHLVSAGKLRRLSRGVYARV